MSPANIRRAFVSGGAGFIGSHIADRLVEAGTHVTIYDNFSTGQEHFINQAFPLKVGDSAAVGVRRIHALVHPGLSFLIVTDGSPQAQAALDISATIMASFSPGRAD